MPAELRRKWNNPLPAFRGWAAEVWKSPWQRIEFITAGVFTCWVILLHVVWLTHAGPLWRDEADTVDFASMPNLSDIWHNLRNEFSAPLYILVAHLWAACGLTSDFEFRLSGFLIALATIAAVWYFALRLTNRTPLLFLAVYAVNPLGIRIGDGLRPYGVSVLLNLLSFTLIWKFLKRPKRAEFFSAALAATLSVQTLYQNALYIMAFCLAAFIALALRGEWKTAFKGGLIGLVPALTLLPFWGIVTHGQMESRGNNPALSFASLWDVLSQACQASGGMMATVWILLYFAALTISVFYGFRRGTLELIYCGAMLVLFPVLYLTFLRFLGLPPHPWYFVVLMASVMFGVDLLSASLASGAWTIVRVSVACALVIACMARSSFGVQLRQSNIDLVATQLKELSRPGDFIVVSKWFYAISLQRYFPAERWTELPPMTDVRIHRYDLLRQAMKRPNAIEPVLDQARDSLRAGHALWVVGELQPLPPGAQPPAPPPYRDDIPGIEIVYGACWMAELAYLTEHATQAETVDVPVPGVQEVNEWENVPLLVFRGWHE